MDMYTPLTFLTGKFFQYMVQPTFTSLPPPTTTHPPKKFVFKDKSAEDNTNLLIGPKMLNPSGSNQKL